MPIYATEEQRADLSRLPDNVPLYMLNLVKYRSQAIYREEINAPKISGEEAYRRYGKIAAQCIEAVGGKIVFFGKPALLFIGAHNEFSYDDVIVVEYPSRSAFIEMQKRTDFQAALVHREAGLDHQILSICVKENFSLDRNHVH